MPVLVTFPGWRIASCALGLAILLTSSSCAEPKEHKQLLATFVQEFVEITPGKGQFPESFQQGSDRENERPVHQVTVSRPFAIAKYEVPQNLYEAVMGGNPSRWKGPRNSVESMTWEEANEFCRKATERLHVDGLLPADELIRLPSESEWEYCCRAGTTTAYSFGETAQKEGDVGPQASLLDPFAWHTGNAAGNDPAVGVLKPNLWGLYDMHGYLWEFCADEWHASYDGAPADGSAWVAAKETTPAASGARPVRRVLRGGSWKENFSAITSASRRAVSLERRDDAIGFRCVKAKAKE